VAEIARALAGQGAQVARRAAGEAVDDRHDVYIADTMGELGLFFSLASVVFMGKSLTAAGGQNLLEPARLGCAVLHGPAMNNFEDMARRMGAAGAAVSVADGSALSVQVGRLLADPAAAGDLAAKAGAFAQAESGVIDRLMDELTPYLTKLGGGGGAS
jgi:3-deoxy-D-manno-octulosonic-acid transferase